MLSGVLLTGSFELLEHLLKHVYRTRETREVQDAEGNTLYHALCRATSDMRRDVIQKAATLLMRYQVLRGGVWVFVVGGGGHTIKVQIQLTVILGQPG